MSSHEACPVIVPLGAFCFAAKLLVKTGLRKEAYPLDYTFIEPSKLIVLLKTKFSDLLEIDNLFSGEENGWRYTGHHIYGERLFWHHDLFQDDILKKMTIRRERLLVKLNNGCLTLIATTPHWSSASKQQLYQISECLKEYNSNNHLIHISLVGRAGVGEKVELSLVSGGISEIEVFSDFTRSATDNTITDGLNLYSSELDGLTSEVLKAFLRFIWNERFS